MASISTSADGRRSIQFRDAEDKRRIIYLRPGFTMKQANALKVRVEALVNAQISGAMDDNLHNWLEHQEQWLLDRLAKVGLVARRGRFTLEDFLREHIDRCKNLKAGTRTAMQIAARRMVVFFGAGRDLRSITEGDCDDWIRWLETEGRQVVHGLNMAAANKAVAERAEGEEARVYSSATIGKTVKTARQFFLAARRRRLVRESPFDHMKGPNMENEERKVYVAKETVEKVIGRCPDAEWRLIIALSRFGGLRCPSEHLGLAWDDIKSDRFWVRSPKTERHKGKAGRWVPIFPELRPYLEDAYEMARAESPDGRVHAEMKVIRHYRSANQNLRTQLLRFIKRAGVEPWPRLFHNLRASCETDLANAYPLHVACTWIGNSTAIAAKHYLKVRDEDIQRAAGLASGAEKSDVTGDVAGSGNKDFERQVEILADRIASLLPQDAAISSYINVLPSVQVGTKGFEPLTPSV